MSNNRGVNNSTTMITESNAASHNDVDFYLVDDAGASLLPTSKSHGPGIKHNVMGVRWQNGNDSSATTSSNPTTTNATSVSVTNSQGNYNLSAADMSSCDPLHTHASMVHFQQNPPENIQFWGSNSSETADKKQQQHPISQERITTADGLMLQRSSLGNFFFNPTLNTSENGQVVYQRQTSSNTTGAGLGSPPVFPTALGTLGNPNQLYRSGAPQSCLSSLEQGVSIIGNAPYLNPQVSQTGASSAAPSAASISRPKLDNVSDPIDKDVKAGVKRSINDISNPQNSTVPGVEKRLNSGENTTSKAESETNDSVAMVSVGASMTSQSHHENTVALQGQQQEQNSSGPTSSVTSDLGSETNSTITKNGPNVTKNKGKKIEVPESKMEKIPDMGSLPPEERRRYERNVREQQRSYKISQQIKELRNVLAESNIPFKPNKFSILMSAVNYIKQLQNRAVFLDTEHRKLVNTINQTSAMVNSGRNPDNMQCQTHIGNESDMIFVQGIDYRNIFSQCTAALCVAALDGRILDCNEEFEVVSGYSKDEISHQSLFNILESNEIDGLFKVLGKMLQDEKSIDDGRPPESYWSGLIVSQKDNIDLLMNITLTRTVEGFPKFFNCALSGTQ